MKYHIEVVAQSVDDCRLISRAGADRIELCQNLKVGGLTPSYELTKACLQVSKIPIYVMLRPHGDSFCYNEAEMKQLHASIVVFQHLQVGGFVFGSLTTDQKIAEQQLKQMLRWTSPFPLTFHRAFDELTSLEEGLDLLNRYEIENILTSGGLKEPLADKAHIFQKWMRQYPDLNIQVGGGINEDNLEKILPYVKYLHFGRICRFHNSWDEQINFPKLVQIIELVRQFKPHAPN